MERIEIEQLLNGQSVIKAKIDHVKAITLKGGKSNPLLGRVTRVTTGTDVTICAQYASYHQMINEAYDRQGISERTEFGARRWGTHDGDTCFILHNDDTYVQLVIDKVGTRKYQVDGKDATDEEVAAIESTLRATPESANQLPLRLAAMNLSNILSITKA